MCQLCFELGPGQEQFKFSESKNRFFFHLVPHHPGGLDRTTVESPVVRQFHAQELFVCWRSCQGRMSII
ncbi:hypothetical protein BDW68DRAFT_170125 [Aspergillus falconensis]